MAATVQLIVNVNEAQVRQSLNNIQQQINQMVAHPYTIQINTQFSPQGMQNLQQILNITNTIRSNSTVNIRFQTQNYNQTVNNLNNVGNTITTVTDSFNRMNQRQRENITNSNILIGALRTLGHVLVHEVRAAFNSALTEMKAVDTELITIQKVTGESAEAMKRYADDAYEVAARLGSGASEYLNAVAEFAKAGYGKQSKELGELAITTAKVGDTTQSMANQFLLSVDAAYRYEGSIEKLTAVLDGANEIGNRFPTSVEKIAEGLGKVSPIAAQAHVGIDELTAAIGTITAVTQRSGAEASTALRALLLNIIGDTKTEIEDGAKWTAGEIEGLRDLLRKYAGDLVKAADETGKVINPMEAVRALYLAMKEGVLTEQELMQQVSDIGGKLRSSQLLALIQNYEKYEQMLETYRDSAGSAAQEYGIYLDSWEAKTKQLSATWTDFVQRQLGTDKIKDLLDKLIKIVENLDNWIPLLKSIAAAIVAFNLPGLITHITRIIGLLTTAHGLLGVLLVAVGAIDSAVRQHVANLQKAAKQSLQNAEDERREVEAMQELVSQYNLAAEGSDAFKTASEKMKTALSNEGIEVNNLTEDYKALMIAKAQAAAVDANTALTNAGSGLAAQYGLLDVWNMDAQYVDLYDKGDSFLSGVQSRLIASGALREKYFKGAVPRYGAADTSPSGVAAYYEAVAAAMKEIETEAYRLKKSGDEAAATNLLDSRFYKDLGDAVSYLGESYTTYSEARTNATEADKNVAGIEEFYSTQETLKGLKLTEEQFGVLVKQIQNSNKMSESQKKLLLSMASSTYPDFAKAIGLVTDAYEEQATAAGKAAEETEKAMSALERYNQATQKGKEKDDPFKSYKGVYDTVMGEAKKGRYGSNAFQYGIAALLDPSYIESFKGDWGALVKDMQKSLGGLYKDADSMGTGLLDAIWKSGEKTKGKLSEIKDELTGEILASFDKKTGDWYISDKPEDIKKLAGKLGMSAESLVAAGIALGAIDPNATTEGLSEALAEILGVNAETEDPAVTAMNASAEAQKASADAEQAAADALNAVVGVASKFFGGNGNSAGGSGGSNDTGNERGEGASEANGGVPGGGSETPASPEFYPESIGGSRFGNPDSRPRYVPDGMVAPGMSFEEMKAAFDRMNGNVVYGMTKGAINEIWGRLTTGDQYGAITVTGEDTTEKNRPGGTPRHHRTAPESTFSGTGQWDSGSSSSVADAVAEGVEEGIKGSSESANAGHWVNGGLPITVTGSIAEGVEQGIKEAASSGTPAFSGTGRWDDHIPGVNQGKFVSSDQIPEASSSVAVDTTEATAALEETQAALDEIDNTEAEATATVDPSGAIEGAAAATSAIESIPTEVASHVVVNVDINMTRHGLGAGGSGGTDWQAETRAVGDEYFHGGPVLVNDEAGGFNPELIVANGRAFIANGGDPAIVSLPRGAVIYTADETRDIFSGGSDLLNIPSFAEGNAYVGKYKYLSKGKKSSGSDSGAASASSGGGSSEFTDDMMKKLEQYMSDILDMAEDALNDQLEAINAQIYALKYQTEAAEKATALEEARLQLLEAEKNLLDANTERTVRYYNAATGQWEWMADQREVMRAQEELYDAQKNLLEAEYDALATAWNELKDEIAKALENNEPIDINAILTALGKSAAKGSLPGLKALIGDKGTYTDDPRAWANFDGGGLAHGIGWMPKGSRGTEAVLDAGLTKAILNPQQNAAFTNFTDSLSALFGMAGGSGALPSSRFSSNVSNLYGGNTYIEGVKIGSDMLNRPLSEVLSTLNLYKNN